MTDKEVLEVMLQRAGIDFENGPEHLQVVRLYTTLTSQGGGCAVALFLFDKQGSLTEVRPFPCEDY